MQGITPDMARMELARREKIANTITPEMARAELEHRGETVGGHLRNIGKSLSDEVKTFVANPGKSLLAGANKIADFVNPAVENTLASGGDALGNSLINMANLIPGVNIPQMQNGDTSRLSGMVGNALGTGLGFVGSAGAAGSGVRGISAALKNIPELTETIANALSKVPGTKKIANALTSTIGKATTGGAAFGASQHPKDRAYGAVEGGIAAGLPTAAFQGLARYGGMASDVLPGIVKDIFKGKATAAEAKIANEMVGNLPVGIGQILDSPALQEVEKGVNRIPFSGGVARAEKVQQAAENQSDKLLSLMRGNQPEEEIARNLQTGIASNEKMHAMEATKRYDDFLNTAKEQGVKITQTPETQSVAQRLLKEHQENQTPLDVKVVKKLEDLSNPELMPDMVKGQVPKSKEIDELHNQIKSLKKSARLVESKDPYLANTYNELASAMRKDLHATAINSKNPDISAKLTDADKYYRENRVPYKQKEIQNIIVGKANLENIQNTLTQSKDHVEKVVSDLPDNLKKSAAYLKFKSAIKEEATGEYTSEPMKLFNAYNRLSPAQKDKLFSNAEQKEFHRLGILAKASKEKGRSSGYLRTAEAAAPLYELLLHGSPRNALIATGIGAGMGAGARGLGNALTNPSIRNAIVNAPTPGSIASPQLNALIPSMQAGMMSQSSGAPPINIDFQQQSPGNVNQLDQQMINDQMLQSDFTGQ